LDSNDRVGSANGRIPPAHRTVSGWHGWGGRCRAVSFSSVAARTAALVSSAGTLSAPRADHLGTSYATRRGWLTSGKLGGTPFKTSLRGCSSRRSDPGCVRPRPLASCGGHLSPSIHLWVSDLSREVEKLGSFACFWLARRWSFGVFSCLFVASRVSLCLGFAEVERTHGRPSSAAFRAFLLRAGVYRNRTDWGRCSHPPQVLKTRAGTSRANTPKIDFVSQVAYFTALATGLAAMLSC